MNDRDLLTTIRTVRGRWKLALILRGAILCVVTLLALLAVTSFGITKLGITPETVVTVRWAIGLLALAAFAALILLPALRRVSDERVALYIEEHEPALQSVLISALNTPATDGGIARALVERAAAQCRDIGFGSRIEKQRLVRNGALLAGTVAIAAIIIGAGPASMRSTARLLLLPTPEAQAAAVMSIAVLPGNDTIARGADIALNAQLHAFASPQAEVVMKGADGEWRRWSMSPGRKPGTFEAVLFDVVAATDYYIEAGAIRSATYRINVVEAPFVRALTLDYVYPAYTGLAPKRVENGGDIVAPKGTTVRVSANTSMPVAEGRLQFDDARSIRMLPSPGGAVTAPLRVMRDGLYHVALPGIDGRMTSASAQYAITAIADQPPTVSVEKPGRDIKVTSVEEVFVSARAEDDYGVARLDLVYSVNGGAQTTVPLSAPAGAHTFFMEELTLKPGDFVSYFVRATDNNAIDGAKSATTDIYFIQIKPFSREYRAAEQAGQPGQGQPEENAGSLSEQQRQIIAATFNVSRDRATYTPQGYGEALTTIELSQKKLREQVNTLLQRMQQRGVVGMDSIFMQISQMLPIAAKEMGDAEARLQQRQPDDALSPEQRALQQLLRAEALYRDVQVQMQQQAGGSGGGGAPPEDLGDLFDLERDQLRNQYETVQRSQQEQAQRQVDETLERLKQLAERQQQEAERQRQAAGAQSQSQGGAGGGGQQRLADEAEQTARQLERLARENNDAQMQEAARRLQQAADAMRRASAQRDGRGLADANAARERLQDARRSLQQNQRQSLQQNVDAARQRADQLRQQQREIAGAGTPQTAEEMARQNQQKSQLGAGVGELEQRLDRLSAEARGSNRDASRKLQEAADAIRESRLRERIRSTQGTAQMRSQEFNRAQEEQISRDLDRVAQELAEAGQAAGSQSAEARAGEASDRARALAQGVEGMRGRGGAAASPNGGNASGAQPGAAAGNQAQRQLRAEARARTQELQGLRRQLQQQGMNPESLEDAMEALQQLQTPGPYNDPEEVDRLLTAVARGLQNLEFDLRAAADSTEARKLYLSSEGKVPAQFKKAVEEYYRSLARKRP